MRVQPVLMAACLSAWMLVACTTTGSGSGTVRDGAAGSVAFQWHSTDNVSGTMTATFADGRSFSGNYFQITSETRVDRLDPLWDGWRRPWRGWPYWYPEPGPQFIKHYSGRVLANLNAAGDGHMRCFFQLIHPSSGMAGGGTGRCQLSDGKSVEATFPAE